MPPIEFSAFRKFAESGDQMLYVQGEKLKGTNTQGNRSAHVFKAATDEFVAAFKKHYGVQFESSLRQFLTPELTQGKPLTARTIKALIDFADKKMGSATSVDAGGRQVDLETLGLDKMRRVGFSRTTKLANAAAGQQETAAATLRALKFGKDGTVDLAAMLRRLDAERKRLEKELDEMPDGPEFNLKNDRLHQLELQINAEETRQTETLSDRQVVDLVENAIRSNPQDFPLLTKYYLDAA